MDETKRTIFDIINAEEGEGSYTTREDLLNVVKDTLRETFEYGFGGDDLEDMNIQYGEFCEKVTDYLLSGKVEFDSAWDNGEVYAMIENAADDCLSDIVS